MITTSNYQLDVLVNGNVVKKYAHEGRAFIEAKSGSEFSLKLKNNSSKRILAVFSVDGIDVITGGKASDTDTGYVINGYATLEVKGYRIDNYNEASFKFIEKGNGKTYAEFKGDASNVGVIGLRVYSEKEQTYGFKVKYPSTNWWESPSKTAPTNPFPYDITWTSERPGDYYSTGATYDSMRSVDSTSKGISPQSINCCVQSNDTTPIGFDMGTGWGSKVTSKVKNVNFEIGYMVCQQEIFYASRESLKQMGIQFEKQVEIKIPKAFDGNMKFCEKPSGWNG